MRNLVAGVREVKVPRRMKVVILWGVGSMRLRILVVDDHELARESIRTAMQFCRCAQPEIIGEAADGRTAIELARRLKPDVVTMDISLPDISGLEVTRRLKEDKPHLPVVVVTMHEDRRCRKEAVRVGAVSYVTKADLVNELPGCLDRLAGQLSPRGTEDPP